MKSPGVIYRRYRQLKRKLLYEKMQEIRKMCGKNCVYGKEVNILDRDKVFHSHICLYNKQVPTDFEICTNAEDCNAFICKYGKKDVQEFFNTIRNKKYPELNVLEWVLDKSLDDAVKEPTIFVKIIVLAISFLENLIKITAKNQKRLMEN